MDSVIISAVVTFFHALRRKFIQSKLYAVIMRIYIGCSKSWRNSAIMKFLYGGKSTAEDGKIARAVYAPFTFLEFIAARIGKKVSGGIKNSVICEFGRRYVHNFMAVNTRFWGIMMLTASVIYNGNKLLGGTGYNKIVLAVTVIGALLCIVNFNVTGFLNGSKAADLAKSCAGVKNINFSFYDEEKTTGRSRLLAAFITGVVMGAAMIFSLKLGLLVPFGLFGMLLVLEYPVTGVYAAVFLAPLISFSSMPLAGICIWTMLSLIIKSITDEGFKWKREGVGAALILFLAVLLVSCIFSFSMQSSLKVWMMYFVFISFYFAIINTIKTRDQLYGLLRLFVISGAFVALYGVMQYVFGWTTTNAWIDEEMFEDDTMRVFSTLANPNVLGEYLLLVIPVSAVFFLKDKPRTLSKWIYLGITGLLFVCLILTQSRGCWLGFVVSVILFITFYEGRWWALVPLILCMLPFVIPQTVVDRLSSIGDMNDSSTSYRVYIWMGAMGILRHYVAGGIGMGEGAFNEVYPFFSYNAIIAPHSHNTFLQLLVEGGIPALAVFIAAMIVFFISARNIYRQRNKKSFNSAMALALGAGVFSFLFQSMFDYTFYNYRVLAIFFMVLAMTISFRYVSGRKDRSR